MVLSLSHTQFDIKLEQKMHAKEAEMHQLQAKTQVQTFDCIFEI